MTKTFPNGKKVPQVASMLDGALYKIRINYEDVEKATRYRKSLKKEEWVTIKKAKRR